MSYHEFIKGQSSKFQDKALGKKTARAFREGSISITKFKENPKPITIEELEATHDLSLTNPED